LHLRKRNIIFAGWLSKRIINNRCENRIDLELDFCYFYIKKLRKFIRKCIKMNHKITSKLYLGFLLFLFWIIFLTCSDNPLTLEYGLDNPLLQGEVRDTVLYATKDTTYLIQSKLYNQSSSRLPIGSYKGFESRPILRFILNLPDSAIFTRAILRLKSDGILSDGNPADFAVTAYPVLNSWVSNYDSVWSDYTQNFDPTRPLGEVVVGPALEDTFSIELNEEALGLLSMWADTSKIEENGGLILDFTEANYIHYLTSINVESEVLTIDPMLIFDYHTPTDATTQTDSASATYDAFIYGVDIPTIPERNYLSTQANYSTLIKFDLEGMLEKYSKGIDVLSANLYLPVDKENSLMGENNVVNLFVQKLFSDINTPEVILDSSFTYLMTFNQWTADSSFIEIISGDERKNFARYVIQSQLIDLTSSSALIIDFQDKISHYSYIASYKRDYDNQDLVPKLFLTFRISPSARF
jgi:hypothetical protein